ncbi:cyclase [Oculatella sp. LEGE 06141]|uniref:SRPBCC family protein n=1 Tax=Oculatella sp. LEGE 06141 TaxID=1828648 RepID=UPI001882CDF5|nr:SRPBCC family protein [Oculatella sp. LEGE 06141]MBE9177650.1 cyclase [Oculatella sp. LEGE 06141]
MTAFITANQVHLTNIGFPTIPNQDALLNGEILIQTQSHSAWGGAVTAQMYLPLSRSRVWQQITDYPRWVHYFPDLTHSEVLCHGKVKRLYQTAKKAFLMFTAQVEIYLQVFEVVHQAAQHVKFQMEKGSFADFSADLCLQDCGTGTLLTYTVKATPTIPVPSILIQEAMRLDLPANMRKMRQTICG